MAYIGKIPGGTALTSRTLDSMTGDGSDTTLTLSQTPDSVIDVAIYYDGIMQRPGIEYTLAGNTITFTTAPANGVFICALTGGAENIASPMVDSVTTDKLVDGVVTNAKITSVASSKLTGALPALDGSALTNITSPWTTSTNDPTISTNPSGGVGSIWVNKTSGEMYVCTNATAGKNAWVNVGGGTGDVTPWSYAGTTSGYKSGGNTTSGGYVRTQISKIEGIAFSNNTVNSSVGDLSGTARSLTHGVSSTTHGYIIGGQSGENSNVQNTHTYHSTVDKFSFSSDNTVTQPFTLLENIGDAGTHGTQTHGFWSAGTHAKGVNNQREYIKKMSYASDSTYSDIGNMGQTNGFSGHSGTSSPTHGYTFGGYLRNSDSVQSVVRKFSFSSDATGTNIGSLTGSSLVRARSQTGSHSTETAGYTTAGTGAGQDEVEKYTYASDSSVIESRSLVRAFYGVGGATSTTSGYVFGGKSTSFNDTFTDQIQKFNFSDSNDATDVGSLSAACFATGNNLHY